MKKVYSKFFGKEVNIAFCGMLVLLFNNCGEGFKSMGLSENSSMGIPTPTPIVTPTIAPTATPVLSPTPQPPTQTPTPAATAIPAPTAPPLPGTGWFRLPDTKITSHCPSGDACKNVVRAWNSGVMDTLRDRLILWGGGHNNYSGNELYALDLRTHRMSRLNDPGKPVVACREEITTSGGIQPASRHTYDGVTYIAHADTYIAFGGAIFGGGGASCPIGSRSIWTYSFQTGKWTKKFDDAGFDSTEVVTVYDPDSRLVYMHDNKNLYAYSLETNHLNRITNRTSGIINATYSTATLVDDDVKNRKWFVMLATRNDQKMVIYYDLSLPNPDYRQLATSGSKAIESCYYPGFTFYPKDGSIVAWYGNSASHSCSTNANSVYKLNLDNGVWSEHTFPNGPTTTFAAQGVFERFSYSAGSKAFILVFDEIQDGYLLKLDNN